MFRISLGGGSISLLALFKACYFDFSWIIFDFFFDFLIF